VHSLPVPAVVFTSFYIVTDPVRHSKMAMVDHNCMVSIAVNDTDFMSSMPPKLTAATGMDALTHAIEAALSKNANPLTDKDAYWAMQAIVQNLPRAVANGQDEAARTMMAYAENVAGMAFSNAGLGMVHAMAHALGGHYNLPHGVCNAVLLPYVLAFNSRSPVCRERFMTIAAAMGLQDTFTPDTAAPAVIQFVRQLSAGVGIPANLAQLNKVDPADFAALAELALHDTCMSTNQITPTRDEVVAVYTAAFRG
jgi:alcohol dehydrogenase